MPVSPSADKRFRRSRVDPSRRKLWRPSWKAVALTLSVCAVSGYALYRAAHLVLSAEVLMVSRITVAGNERTSRGEVMAIVDELEGQNMMAIDLDRWRRKLMDSPWIANAEIRRVFPGTLSVVITEREPLGIGRIGEGLFLIDHRGVIIDEFGPSYAQLDLPIISGLAAASEGGAVMVDESRASLAGRLLTDFQSRPDLAKQISQIDVSDVRDAVVILEGDPAMVRVGDSDFVQRVQSYLDLAPALRERVPEIDYVDLRFDERVYVRPAAR